MGIKNIDHDIYKEVYTELRNDLGNWYVDLAKLLKKLKEQCERSPCTASFMGASSYRVSSRFKPDYSKLYKLVTHLNSRKYMNLPMLKKTIVQDNGNPIRYDKRILSELDSFEPICTQNTAERMVSLKKIINAYYFDEGMSEAEQYDAFDSEFQIIILIYGKAPVLAKAHIKDKDIADLYMRKLRERGIKSAPVTAADIAAYERSLANAELKDVLPSPDKPKPVDLSIIGMAGFTPIEMRELLARNDYNTPRTAKALSEKLGKTVTRQNVYAYCRRHNITIKNRYANGTRFGDIIILEQLERTSNSNGNVRNPRYRCRCKCGAEVEFYQAALAQNSGSKYHLCCEDCRRNGRRRKK